MGLAAFNLLFVPAALLAHPDGAALGHALATWGPLPGGLDTAFLTLVLANVGATVTPWMIFFQQSAVVDKGLTRADLPQGRMDTGDRRGARRRRPRSRRWSRPRRCSPPMSTSRNSPAAPISRPRCGR